MSALVELTQFGVRTNSRTVADVFEKQHKDVLRTIDNMLEQKPELIGRNFTPNEADVQGGFGVRQIRCFEMDRDGFTLVAMGFTGEKALDWKLAYIDAFNRMEGMLAVPEPESAAAKEKSLDADALETLGPALAIVREARQLFGRPAARRLWPRLGLPDPNENTPLLSAFEPNYTTEMCENFKLWLAERTFPDAGGRVGSTQLFDDYVVWCKEQEIVPHNLTKFGRLLNKAGVPSAKYGRIYRTGIGLKD